MITRASEPAPRLPRGGGRALRNGPVASARRARASRFSPIPLTRRRSSTAAKGPPLRRSSTTASASRPASAPARRPGRGRRRCSGRAAGRAAAAPRRRGRGADRGPRRSRASGAAAALAPPRRRPAGGRSRPGRQPAQRGRAGQRARGAGGGPGGAPCGPVEARIRARHLRVARGHEMWLILHPSPHPHPRGRLTMITVEKIGGTSMSQFDEVPRRTSCCATRQGIYGRVYVVSAYAGVTNWLLEHKKTGEQGVYAKFAAGGDYTGALDGAHRQAQGDQQGLRAASGCPWRWPTPSSRSAWRELKEYLDSMHHVLASGYLKRESVLLAGREMLAAIGEAHTAFNSVEILKAKGVQALLLDLSGFDDDEPLTIDERIHESFKGVDPAQPGGGGHRLHQGRRGHHAGVRPRLLRGHLQQGGGGAQGRRGGHPQGVPPLLGRPGDRRRRQHRGGRHHQLRRGRPARRRRAWRPSTPRPPSPWSWPASPSGSRTPSSRTTRARSSPRTTSASRPASR